MVSLDARKHVKSDWNFKGAVAIAAWKTNFRGRLVKIRKCSITLMFTYEGEGGGEKKGRF